jgi:hypothetical protein
MQATGVGTRASHLPPQGQTTDADLRSVCAHGRQLWPKIQHSLLHPWHVGGRLDYESFEFVREHTCIFITHTFSQTIVI